MKSKKYISCVIWIIALIAIGSIIGSLTKSEVNTWYSNLNRSPLTPPNYVFPIAWTILYGMIGFCGWFIWRAPSYLKLEQIKILYIIQLILNWCWMPLFFRYHLTGLSLLNIIIMDFAVSLLIYLAHAKLKSVSLLMTPYLLWILFATHLNYYIWQYN